VREIERRERGRREGERAERGDRYMETEREWRRDRQRGERRERVRQSLCTLPVHNICGLCGRRNRGYERESK
jgi:hypothetical protein